MTANRINRILIALIAAITVIGAVVWDYYTPYTADDYFYREIIRDDFAPTTETWPGANEDITTLPQAWESIKNHTVYNGRLANFTHILMQPAGRTAESIFLGLCIGALFLLLCRCIRSFSGTLTVPGIIAATLSFWIILPWHDTFQSLDFQCNYVLPSLVVVILILLFKKSNGTGTRQKILIFLLAVSCSWLHEGFGCAAFAYFLTTALYPTENHSRKYSLFIATAIAVGIMVNLACGTANRISNSEGSGSFTVQILVQVGLDLWPFALSATTVGLALLCKKSRFRKKYAYIYVPLFAGTVGGLLLSIVFKSGARMLWPCNLFCLLVICSLFNDISHNANKKWQSVIGLIFVPLYAWWMTQQCIWNKNIGDESRIIEQQHGANRDLAPTVFYLNHIPGNKIPYWLAKLTQQPLDGGWNSECFGTYLSGRCGSVLVLPPTLENLPFESWPRIPGNSHLRGAYPMMAARDSADLRLTIKYGEYSNNISPATRLLMLIKNRGITKGDSVRVKTTALRIILPDGSTAYRYCPEPLPRTVEGRHFAAIDILDIQSPEDERNSR